MATKHSQEPWAPCCYECSAILSGEVRIASFHIDEDISEEVMRANKERVIACVNACRDLNPEHVADAVGMLELVIGLYDDTKTPESPNGRGVWAQARDLLAKVKPTKPIRRLPTRDEFEQIKAGEAVRDGQ